MIAKYREFLDAKSQMDDLRGFEPLWLSDSLFDFQKHLVEWSLRVGEAAVFADCGLGKTLIELVWGTNVVRKTNRHVLLLTPLAVADQTIREGEKFDIECRRSKMGEMPDHPTIVVANYERLHYFDPDDFVGCMCDESSILKNFDGKTKAAVTEFVRRMPYRLLCTATAAPNDFFELGTSSEALGYLGFQDMLTRYFKEDVAKDYLGWGRKTFRFRGYAEQPFWRWVCSWSRACRKPSDLGFQDDRFDLPPLRESEHVIKCSRPRPGTFFPVPVASLVDQRRERRDTLPARCEAAAELVLQHDGASVVWCHLNDEADMVENIVPGALQVSGSMSEEKKEERLLAFQSGDLKVLVTKPRIGCFGLNWQHCHNVVTFASHSYEQYYQAVRRCWRFGQEREVVVNIIISEGEQRVLANLKRKATQADRMFKAMIEHMSEAIHVDRDRDFGTKEDMPAWL